MLIREDESCPKYERVLFAGIIAVCAFVVAASFCGSKDIRKSKKYPKILKQSYDGLSPEDY